MHFVRTRLDADYIAFTTNSGRGKLRQARRRRIKRPACVRRLDPIFGVDAEPDAGADREILVGLRLLQKEAFHLRETIRLLGREVVGLRKILIELVEFPTSFRESHVANPGLTVSQGVNGPNALANQPSS